MGRLEEWGGGGSDLRTMLERTCARVNIEGVEGDRYVYSYLVVAKFYKLLLGIILERTGRVDMLNFVAVNCCDL